MARAAWFNEASQSASYLHELPTPQRLEVFRFLSLGIPSSWPPAFSLLASSHKYKFKSWTLPIVPINICPTD